ncbi:30S ribosomal protein S17 [Candidatus Woesearchaeota archaeon]|nr:MAG: 30S ribosomal protein S17 [Candidatus Woesearchaeota archaeon]
MRKVKNISTHGRSFKGVIISDKMHNSATVEWTRKRLVPKYERLEKARTRVKAHNSIGAKKGDLVRVKECRPLSKTKHFIITEILSSKEAVEESR